MPGHRPTKPTWSPLAVSAVVHLLLIVAAAGLSRQIPATESANRPDRPAEEARRIDMIYMPPPEPTPPAPPVELAAPPPPPAVRRTVPEPEPNAPPEAAPLSGTEADEPDDQEEGEPSAGPTPAPAPSATKPAATMESEARRIFGRPRLPTRAGAGPQAVRPMEAWFPDRAERCIPRPTPPSDSAGPAEMGTVMGRIFRQDNGRPLAGAHLQMVGTPHVAFTDGNGEYRFRFDLALVDNCRTQYVKVTASGYESRLLVLVVGRDRSEDVRLRRR